MLRRGHSIGWTGATFGYPTTEELQQRRLPPGLYLTGAVPGTPAAAAGLGGRGELLAGVDDRPIGPSLSSYCAAVAGRPGGDKLRLTLARPGGKTREVEVALRERSAADCAARSSPAAARAAWGRPRRWSSSAAGRCSRGRSPRRATPAWRRSSSRSRVRSCRRSTSRCGRSPSSPRIRSSGVIAALERAAPRAVVVLACDMPFVPAELIARLAALDAVAAAPPGEGFPARYESAALPVLRAGLEREAPLRAVLAELAAVEVAAPERALLGINDPESLARAAALLR